MAEFLVPFHLLLSRAETETDILMHLDMHSRRKRRHMRAKHAKEASHYCFCYGVIVSFCAAVRVLLFFSSLSVVNCLKKVNTNLRLP